MTDARFPERWLNDRRVLRLSAEGFRLFVIGMAWSVSNRTDGVVDEDDIAMMPKVHGGQIDELVKAGLWKQDKDTWLIVDFASTQTGAAELTVLDNLRRRDREKKARQRAKGDSPGGTSRGTVPGDSIGQDRLGEARTGTEEEGSHEADFDGSLGAQGVQTMRGAGDAPPAESAPLNDDWPDVAAVGAGRVDDWALSLYDKD